MEEEEEEEEEEERLLLRSVRSFGDCVLTLM
jgi:hypothetical protein